MGNLSTTVSAAEARSLILAGKAPKGLRVGGGLDLRGTPITALPEGLSVGGGLDLRGTQITAWGRLTVRGREVASRDVAEERIRAVAARALSKPGALEMSYWHHCATSHCIAGWATTLAGEQGDALEADLGPATAGLILLGPEAASHFYDSDDAARAWLRSKLEAVD